MRSATSVLAIGRAADIIRSAVAASGTIPASTFAVSCISWNCAPVGKVSLSVQLRG